MSLLNSFEKAPHTVYKVEVLITLNSKTKVSYEVSHNVGAGL